MSADAATLVHRDDSVASTNVEVEVAKGLAPLAADWRALETRAVVSPYQRYEFVEAWCRNAAAGARIEPAIGVVRNAAGRAIVILPFGLAHLGPVTTAMFLGGSHMNFNLPLIDPATRLDAGAVPHLLRSYCRAARADRLALRNLPRTWNGQPHPFASLRTQDAPCRAWAMTLTADPEVVVATHVSKDTRSKLSRKLRRLQELPGYRFVVADSAADRVRLAAAYLAQKSLRLKRIGADDPFAVAGMDGFLIDAATDGSVDGGFQFVGLEAEGKVLAVLGGIRHGEMYSLAIMSFDMDSEHAKHSPGELLLQLLIERQARLGIRLFDFGCGDARYKEMWSDTTIEMFEASLSMSVTGAAASAIGSARTALLRSIKRNDRLYTAAKSARAWLAARRG